MIFIIKELLLSYASNQIFYGTLNLSDVFHYRRSKIETYQYNVDCIVDFIKLFFLFS